MLIPNPYLQTPSSNVQPGPVVWRPPEPAPEPLYRTRADGRRVLLEPKTFPGPGHALAPQQQRSQLCESSGTARGGEQPMEACVGSYLPPPPEQLSKCSSNSFLAASSEVSAAAAPQAPLLQDPWQGLPSCQRQGSEVEGFAGSFAVASLHSGHPQPSVCAAAVPSLEQASQIPHCSWGAQSPNWS